MPLALIWELLAVDKASPVFARVGASAATNAAKIDLAGAAATRAGGAMGKASKGFAALTGVSAKLGFAIGGVAAVVAAFNKGQQFQKQMLQIQTLTGGTTAEVTRMSKALLDLSGKVATGPTQLATSLYHVESVGLRGGAALNVVKIAAEGAKVGMADLEQTTNALTSTVASGIPGVKNMQQAMGALVTIVGAGDMKLSDLNAALGGGILSVVKGYGLSLTNVGAALATFGDNNIRGADAATALRMAVQSLAVPAARGADAITAIGLKMDTLQKDMQTGGLNKALLDLNAHMKAAGITSVEVGGFLTEAFGKRAGIGLTVLMNQLDRFEQKTRQIQEGAGSFASKWQATTHTVGFAFERVGAQLQTLGVRAFEVAGPALSKFADFLGVTIPHAIGQLIDVLRPLIDTVGNALVGAWHAASTVLSAVGSALSSVGGFLKEHKTLVTTVATAVLTMWAAWKAYTIATTAIAAIRLGFMRLASVAPLAIASVGKSVATLVAGLSPLQTALIGIGIVISAAVLHSQSHSQAMEIEAQRVRDLTDAIEQDNGALAAHARAVVTDALGTSGAFAAARQLGVNLKLVTDAALGNSTALAAVEKQAGLTGWQLGFASRLSAEDAAHMLASGTAADKETAARSILLQALLLNNSAVKGAVQAAKDHAAANGKSTASIGSLSLGTQGLTQQQKDLAAATKETQVTLNGTTYAMKAQSSAADVLNAAIARLSGDRNAVALAQLALKDALAGVTAQVKQNGTSLSDNTAKGRSNLEWLHQQIDTINNVASAQIKNGASTQRVTNTLGANEQALRRAAVAAGLNAGMVDKLIRTYAATPKKIETDIKANTDPATTAALALQKKLDTLVKERLAIIKAGADPLALLHVQDQIDALTAPRSVPITPALTNDTLPIYLTPRFIAANAPPGHARGGGVADGYFTVGENGYELGHKSGSTVQIFTHAASVAMTGMDRVPGYATGTGVTIGGTTYSTQKEADAAVAKAWKAFAHALTIFGRSITKTGADVKSAFSPILDALKTAGIDHAALRKLATEDNALARAVNERTRDMAKLQSLIQARRQEQGSIAGTVRGSFDIATAGGGPSGSGKPTFGTIYAQALQDRNLVRRWAAGIRRLGHEFGTSPVAKAMLRRLAEDGPGSWPQVSALLDANPKQLANLVATERQISETGRSVGGYVSGRLFNQRITAQRDIVRQDRHEVERLFDRLDRRLERLEHAFHVTLKVDGKTLATSSATGANRNARRT